MFHQIYILFGVILNIETSHFNFFYILQYVKIYIHAMKYHYDVYRAGDIIIFTGHIQLFAPQSEWQHYSAHSVPPSLANTDKVFVCIHYIFKGG